MFVLFVYYPICEFYLNNTQYCFKVQFGESVESGKEEIISSFISFCKNKIKNIIYFTLNLSDNSDRVTLF